MKMKKIIKIWLIALAVCGLLGLGLLLVGGVALKGSFYKAADLASFGPYSFRFHTEHSMHEDWDDEDWRGCRGGHTHRPGHSDRIRGLSLELAGLDRVSIVCGDDFDLLVQGPDDHLKSYVEDGIWHVQNVHRRSGSRVKIQLPRDAEFDNVELDLAAAQFIADSLNTDSLELSMAAGAAELNGLNCRELELQMVAGEAKLNGVVRETADLEVAAGACTLTMPRPEGYTYSIESGMGSVCIDGHRFEGVSTAENGRSGHGPELDISCSAGSLDVVFEDVL